MSHAPEADSSGRIPCRRRRPLLRGSRSLRGPLAVLLILIGATGCVAVTPKNALAPSPPNLPEAARDNTELGAGYLREGRLDLALPRLKQAVEQDPSYAAAHSTLALAYAQRGDADLAEIEYRRALELGSDPGVRNNFGVFLCEHGKSAEADRYFMQAVQNRDYPTPEAAWANAGLCARKAGDTPRAVDDFRQALQINPDSPDALGPLAEIAYANGQYLQARAYIQRYDRLGRDTAITLLVAANIERALNHADAARAYEIKLIRNFPDSEETAQLLKRNPAP